jgi:hypothetical protein
MMLQVSVFIIYFIKKLFFLDIKIEENKEEEDKELSLNIEKEDEELDSSNIIDSKLFDFDTTP